MSFVCTGWGTYPGACFGSVFQEQAPSCVPAFKLPNIIGEKRKKNRAARVARILAHISAHKLHIEPDRLTRYDLSAGFVGPINRTV